MKVLIMTVLAALALNSGAAAQEKPIAFGGGQTGSSNFAANASIARILSQQGGLNVRVLSYGGVGSYFPLINTGELDFAAITFPAVLEAMTGVGTFEGRKQENIRLVARLMPQYVGIFVRKTSPIKQLSDLKGTRVTWGLVSQPTQIYQMLSMLAAGGIGPNDVIQVPAPSIVRGVDDFAAGRTDSGFFSLGGGRLVEADTQVGGIRFLPIPDGPEAVAALRKYTAGAYVVRREPRQGQVGIGEATNVFAYDYVFVAGAHIADETIVRVLKLIADHEKELIESAPVMRDLDAKNMAKDLEGLPYHPGAIKYFKEIGQWPPKRG
jgi:hypothetical protein